MQCTACQTALPADANFCSHCGTARPNLALGQTTKLMVASKVETLRAGKCPVCLSAEVYMQSGGFYGDRGFYGNIDIKLTDFGNQEAPLNTYVCLQCGYVELFLTTNAPLAMIQKHWKRVESDF